MKKISCLTGLFLFFFSISTANAATIHFDGNIANHNDVIYTYFTLDNDSSNIRVWTDSFMSALNFDPITALWDSAGNLLAQNDDNSGVNPSTQTYFDSGFTLPTLSAGTYLFTMTTYANFAVGTTLAQGFAYDNQAPIAMANWCQPASHCNMGTYWSVWLDGVDGATNNQGNAVPEPATLALLGLGLAAARVRGRKKSAL